MTIEQAWKKYSSNGTLRPSSYDCFAAGWYSALEEILKISFELNENEPAESVLFRIDRFLRDAIPEYDKEVK